MSAAFKCALALVGLASSAPLFFAQATAQAEEAAAPTMLRLRSGDVLWGQIAEHDPDGLRFQRLDTSGVVRLPWSYLDPTEERTLRLRFGYVDSQTEELMTDADRALLSDGTEVVGLITSRTDDLLWFKRSDSTFSVDKRRVASASTVQVPALDIFTKEELYQQKAFELQAELLEEGRVGAQAHDELALFSERLFDYPHAAEHFRIAAKIDPSFEPERMQAAIARAERKAELQEQVDVLAKIDLWRARKRYDKALELLDTFGNLYPDTPLIEDLNKMRERVQRHQERDVREEIVRRMHANAVRLARDAARQKETYEEALAYVEEQMVEELLGRVQEDLAELAPGIEEGAIQKLWGERKGGRYRQASYGLGTWILGEDRARLLYDKDKDAEEEDAPKKESSGEARKQLEKRIEQYLRNQEHAQRAKSAAHTEDDPNEFWSGWTSGGKSQFLQAYFAEFSGLFDVQAARLSNCRECGGTGARDFVRLGSAITGSEGSSLDLVPCPTCHTVGVVRRIRYR